MEGETKRKLLAYIDECEVDTEGYPAAVLSEAETEPVLAEAEPEMPVVSDEVAVAAVEGADILGAVAGVDEVATPKYVNKNFAQKMYAADEIIQDRYDEVRNYALRFKKLKARISKKFESINQGRLQFVKLSVAGKTLKLYLNMDISEVDPKFRCKDMSDKVTYATVPVMLRIKSGRAVRYAKMLIDQCANKYGLVVNKKFVEVDSMQVIEDFLQAREAKKLGAAGGAAADYEEDVSEDVADETAMTADVQTMDEAVGATETVEAVEATEATATTEENEANNEEVTEEVAEAEETEETVETEEVAETEEAAETEETEIDDEEITEEALEAAEAGETVDENEVLDEEEAEEATEDTDAENKKEETQGSEE